MKKHYKKRGRTFALRTIRNGQVKIGGQWFYPCARWVEYDGRLDGMRYAFARYWTQVGGEEWVTEDFVSCWGTAQYYEDPESQGWLDDPQIVDGAFPWLWWYTQDLLEKRCYGQISDSR